MTELKFIKFANSVKCGTEEKTSVRDHDAEIILKDNFVVEMTDKKTGRVVKTTLMNTIYWEEKVGTPTLVTKPITKATVKL